MPVYFTKRAFLPDGWANDVQITVNEQGNIQRIMTGSSDTDCQILSGPIVPGMPNLHSHAFQRMMSGLAEIAGNPQDSFWTWRDLMYRLVQRLTPEYVGVIARQLYIEMLKGGYTQVAEFHYLHHSPDGSPYSDPDFVVTGCGTGQGAMMSLNIHPGVVCGYCIDPADAFLFAQINNGNALSLPFAKGFGWGAELNVRYIFEKAFTGVKGEGYPLDRKEPQVRNAGILNQVKAAVVKENYLDTLRAIDPELVKTAVSGERFQQCFFDNCQVEEIKAFVKQILA